MRVGTFIAAGALFVMSCPVWAAAPEGQASSGVFDGYLSESIWTLVWFFVLLLVLWRFAWKPILAGLNSRQEHIERQISDAEKMRTDAQKVLSEYQARLSDADRQGRDIIAARTKEAEHQALEIEQAKQRDIEQMKLRAVAELERERLDAEEDLWQQAGQIVRQLGMEVFGKSLDEQDNQILIDQAIAHLRSQPDGQTAHPES